MKFWKGVKRDLRKKGLYMNAGDALELRRVIQHGARLADLKRGGIVDRYLRRCDELETKK